MAVSLMVRPSNHFVDGVVIHGDRILWYQIDGTKHTPEKAREANDMDSRIYVGEVRVNDNFFKDKYSDLSPEHKQLFDIVPRIND